jgi:hypothetical protein
MTTYYLSASTGQNGVSQANSSGIAEATSAPTADCVVTFANAPNCSRGAMIRILDACVLWLKSDGSAQNGAAVIPFSR